MLIAQIVDRFLPCAFREKVGNDDGQAVVIARARTTRDTSFDIRVVTKIYVFKSADRSEKGIFPDDRSERIFRMIPSHEIERKLIHILHSQKAQRRGGGYRIRALFGILSAYRARTIQKDLHLHLSLVCKKFEKVLLEPTVQVPIDPTNIIP
jgi:hypothetical protein